MGLLSSLSSFTGGLLDKAKTTTSGLANVAASIAAKADAVIPHPANGGFENVVRVLSAPFTGGHVSANVSNPTLKKGLELVSNNPLTTAGVAAGGYTAVRYAAAPAAKLIGSSSGMVKTAASTISSSRQMATATPTGIVHTSPSGSGGILSPSSMTPATASPAHAARTRAPASHRRRSSARRSPRRRSHRKATRRSSRRHYGTSRQYSRKGGKSVHYTKKGQPYIIMSSGKARFIKKSRR